MASSIDVEKIRNAQRAQGPATILAVGTATPSNCIYQADFPDFYFRVTKSEHMVDLKEKLKLICEKSSIRKRYIHLTEEFLNENPDVGVYNAPSLDIRHDVCVVEVPKLAHKAAIEAIKEWGHPKSEITHLIFCTTSAIEMPGPDYQLTKLLGLNPSVKRHMIYNQGCFGGGTVLRQAKDLAENNKGARVLAVCCEVTLISFRGPNENQIDSLIGQAIFADAAGAVIVGSDPDLATERPLFQMVSTAQTILPDTDRAIGGQLKEVGLKFNLIRKLPSLLSECIEKALIQAFSPLGITDWNSIFWIVHPGGRAILDDVEVKLGLNKNKMRASRHVLSEYGNISSAAVLFIIDEMRKKSTEDGAATTGEGLDWGVLFGFGPGVTIETIVLHSLPKVTKV